MGSQSSTLLVGQLSVAFYICDTLKFFNHGCIISSSMCVLSCSVVADSLRPHELQASSFCYPWNFPGKNTGSGCHFLLQGIFPIHGLNCLLHWQADSLPLSNLGSLLLHLILKQSSFTSARSDITVVCVYIYIYIHTHTKIRKVK